MVRTNQGGSILSFIIIGGVMALLLVGGAYFVRNTLVPSDRGVGVTSEQDESDEGLEEPSENEADEPEVEEVQPQEDEDVGSEVDEQTDDEASEQPDEEPLPVTGYDDRTSTPDNLPETGIADVFVSGVMLSALMAVLVVYRRSRAVASSF